MAFPAVFNGLFIHYAGIDTADGVLQFLQPFLLCSLVHTEDGFVFAGKGIANPIATILSAAMMLRYTFDLDKEADAIENAVKQVLKEGYRTIDIMPQAGESTEGIKQVGTAKMGDLIAERV